MVGFCRLIGRSDVIIDMDPTTTNIEFFMEYDLLGSGPIKSLAVMAIG
jgi:hypothetical protein